MALEHYLAKNHLYRFLKDYLRSQNIFSILNSNFLTMEHFSPHYKRKIQHLFHKISHAVQSMDESQNVTYCKTMLLSFLFFTLPISKKREDKTKSDTLFLIRAGSILLVKQISSIKRKGTSGSEAAIPILPARSGPKKIDG